MTVYGHTKLARAFEIFRKLGMRHLCVINTHGMLIGLVTRKNLMTYRLSDRCAAACNSEGLFALVFQCSTLLGR